MRKWIRGSLVFLLILAVAMPALAWGTAAHVAIGLGVAQARHLNLSNRYLLLQALYGTTAPDFALVAREPLKSALFEATHEDPGYLEVPGLANPLSPIERAFAFGWLTHNQVWGADLYAHLLDPLLEPPAPPGYVVERAIALRALGSGAISAQAAHDYIEAAVDLLLDQQPPNLGLPTLLRMAAYYRDPRIPRLLARAYGDVAGGPAKIIALESAFRSYAAGYARVLALPTGQDDALVAYALAAVEGLTPARSAAVLAQAKALCLEPEHNYRDALLATIALVASGPWP
jgi:hypothetical protein